jgi:hypothetical protein
MKLFGLNLKRAQSDESDETDNKYLLSSKSKDPLFGGASGIPNEVYRKKVIYAKVLDKIQLPDPGSLLDDIWKCNQFNDLMRRFIKMLEGTHFSICVVRDLKVFYSGKDENYNDPWRHLQAYKRLNSLHCQDYNTMPKEVLDSIVPYINEILNHGNILNGKTTFRNENLQLK